MGSSNSRQRRHGADHADYPGAGRVRETDINNSEQDMNPPLSPPDPPQMKKPIEVMKQVNNNEDPGICKICLDKEYDMVAIPCGHIGVCQECCNNMWNPEKPDDPLTCPFCNKEGVEFFRVYCQ
jgi:C3HC4-type zinc finger (RING finger) protein